MRTKQQKLREAVAKSIQDVIHNWLDGAGDDLTLADGALSAALPLIRAEALREAADVAQTHVAWALGGDLGRAYNAGAHDAGSAILALIDTDAETFQGRVQPWLLACFGERIAADREERNHRFLEEALELVQACGCTAHEAHQLVDYTFSRPVGEPSQEVGGVMVTLAALCLANGLDMHANGETELARIWTKVEQIRAKQAAKPKHSPLPACPTPVQHMPGRD
jgi:hypothetical protein